MIKTLDIDLFPESSSKNSYEKARSEYIASYRKYVPSTRKYIPGFFVGYWTGEYAHYENDPVMGEAEWNSTYPSGYEDWAGKQKFLNAYGEQRVIDKVNEIIKYLNKKK